jgi:hypothetical protein
MTVATWPILRMTPPANDGPKGRAPQQTEIGGNVGQAPRGRQCGNVRLGEPDTLVVLDIYIYI